MIPADILTALLAIGLAVVPTWLVLRWAGRAVARKRARLTAGQKIIAGLEDAVAHARGEPGRVTITEYPRRAGDMRPIDGD